ncbi:MAG: ATP-binding protein [Pseudonocardiaceae bacterium]
MVVVLDELPYLTGTDPSFDSVLQRVWDHTLEGRPVLLVVVGSDLPTMEAVSSYDRPLYGRVRLERVVLPLNLAEVAEVLGLGAPEAVDAYLTVGGFPRVLLSWARGTPRREFVRAGLSDPTSALVVIGERMLAAEFPEPENARAALEAVGHGERSFSALSDRSGLSGTSLHRALALLRGKRVVEGEDPLSTARGGRATRYRVADPYLRFWLRFIGPALADVERGRADLAVTRAEDGWSSYRGRAVEPLVRQSLERLAPVPGLGAARDFGGYWTRANDVEVDLVGVTDRRQVQNVAAVGSIKWRDGQPFSTADAANLRRAASVVPGADDTTNLVAVSRSGFVDELGEVVLLGPSDLLSAWSG